MIRKKKKFQKLYVTECNLLIAQDLLQAHHQIVLITILKEFMKLNVNTNTMIKNVKYAELNRKIENAFLNTQTFKTI